MYQSNIYHVRETIEINQSESAPRPPANICRCCLSPKDLRSISKPYMYHGKNEFYSSMLSNCFTPELSSEEGFICSDCVRRLRAALSFRHCVESARDYLNSLNTLEDKHADPPLQEIESVTFPQYTDPIIRTNSYEDNSNSYIIKNETKPQEVGFYSTNQQNGHEFSPDEEYCPPDVSLIPEDPALPEPTHDSPASDSSSEEDDFDDFFSSANDTPQLVFSKTEFDVGEQRTLPYVLDNTDRTCEICHKEFSFYGDLLKHMPEHYPNHICDICGKICATRKSLVFHAKTHTNVRLDCKLCHKSFKNKSNLNAHVKVQHRGEKILFKCSLCGDFLNTYNARIKHMAEKHGREDKAYKCLQCPCKYRLGSHLRAHVRRVHLQEKNHRCGDCGLSFFTRKCLDNHALKHSGARDYACGVCHKTYGRRESLRQHQRTHESEHGKLYDPYQVQAQDPCGVRAFMHMQ